MDVVREVRIRGGIVHRRWLRQQGASTHSIRREVDAGLLLPIRRDWVATSDCSQLKIRAVIVGGRLGCVSAARDLGLWTLDDGLTHVTVNSRAGHINVDPGPGLEEGDRDVVLHWSSSRPASTRSARDDLPDVLQTVARCRPIEEAVAVFDSAMRTGLISLRELQELRDGRHASFARVLGFSDARADSGIESIPRVLLALCGVEMRIQESIDGHPVDGLIGESLVIQLDGFGPHAERRQRNRDLEQDVRMMLRGYHVLRFSGDQVVFRRDWVVNTILAAMAQGKHHFR